MITERNNEFELYQHYNGHFPFHRIYRERNEWTFSRIQFEVLYEKVRDKIEKAPSVSDTSDEDLQDKTTGPLCFEAFQK